MQALYPFLVFTLLAALLGIGCAPVVRIDFTCRSFASDNNVIISECGDAQSWADYFEKQAREKAKLEL